jgi:hypothetical protein
MNKPNTGGGGFEIIIIFKKFMITSNGELEIEKPWAIAGKKGFQVGLF